MRTLLTALLTALVCQIGMGSEYHYDSRGNLKEVRVNTEQPYYNPNNDRSVRGYGNGGYVHSSKKFKKTSNITIRTNTVWVNKVVRYLETINGVTKTNMIFIKVPRSVIVTNKCISKKNSLIKKNNFNRPK